MAIDMSKFHQAFFEESFEGLEVVESSLLSIDPDNPNEDSINTVFRLIHSIKGGSKTFGFSQVGDFSHVMEDLLDSLRSKEKSLTKDLVDLLLKCTDFIKEVLENNQANQNIDLEKYNDLLGKLNFETGSGDAIASSSENKESDDSADSEGSENTTNSEENNQNVTFGYKIDFIPNRDILKTGNDPVRIFRELKSLGEMTVTPLLEKVPYLEDMNPNDLFIHWKITIVGDIVESSINEVFEWVDDLATIRVEEFGDRKAYKQKISSKSSNITDEPIKQVETEKIEVSSKDTVSSSSGSTDDKKSGVSEDVKEEKVKVKPAKDAEPEAVAKKQDVNTEEYQEKELIAPAKSRTEAPVVHVKSNIQEASSIRVSTEKVDKLVNMVGELVVSQSQLNELVNNFKDTDIEKLKSTIIDLDKSNRELQDAVMHMRMLPISMVFGKFPRMVRELTEQLGKKINLKLLGEQTEIDKTVLEKISDPLVHLIRNSADHGIETPDIRKAAGKSDTGCITLNAFHKGGNIVVEITDDGKGLNTGVILEKAVENGLVKTGDSLSRAEIYELIFHAGFSTASAVSDVSGRGVGMDVVRKNILDMHGDIEVTSVEGNGSTFTIRLPLTMAILDGQLVKIGEQVYIIPVVNMSESIKVDTSLISNVDGDTPVYHLRDEYIPIIKMSDVFNIESSTDIKDGLLVVVENENKKYGIFVEDILSQQQVVIKNMDVNYKRVQGIAGASTLGDGSIALIVDISGFIKLSGLTYKKWAEIEGLKDK